jgi:hypothetical protein
VRNSPNLVSYPSRASKKLSDFVDLPFLSVVFRVFLPSFDHRDLQLVDPFLSAFVSIRSNAHSTPNRLPALFPRQVLHLVLRVRHPLSPPNWRKRSDLLDILILKAADGSLGDSRLTSACTIKAFLFQVRGLILEGPAYLYSSPSVRTSVRRYLRLQPLRPPELRRRKTNQPPNRDGRTRERRGDVEP